MQRETVQEGLLYLPMPYLVNVVSHCESEPCHTLLVPRDQVFAFVLRVVAFGEQHAFVAGGFLVFAYAARLSKRQRQQILIERRCIGPSDLFDILLWLQRVDSRTNMTNPSRNGKE